MGDDGHVEQVLDASRKRAIAAEVLCALPQWFGIPESTHEYIDDSAGQPFWAYVRGGAAIGFVTVERTSDCVADIHVLGVLPQYHRQGVGRELVRAVLGDCRDQGMQFLQVKTVAAGHDEAYDRTNRFYEAMGFRRFEVFPTLWDAANPCQVLVMTVPPRDADSGADEPFWRGLDALASASRVVVDRPRGSRHPRFPDLVYPLDYGYLDGTTGGDGEGIDCWLGSGGTDVTAVFVTADPGKRDAEVKLCLGCDEATLAELRRWYEPQNQQCLLVRRAVSPPDHEGDGH